MAENHIDSKSTEQIISESLKNGITYADYRSRVAKLVAEGKTTGTTQSEALIEYTKLNDRRMKRFDKTVKIDEKVAGNISKVNRKLTWLVLTESWCGDAAPALPVMNKIAELNENIDLRIVLRDRHLDLMNRFLTNGGMSIPKLILWDSDKDEVIGDWGPRPKPAAELVADHKAKHGTLLPEIKEEIQVWYNKDKGQTIIDELTGLLLENVGNSALL